MTFYNQYSFEERLVNEKNLGWTENLAKNSSKSRKKT